MHPEERTQLLLKKEFEVKAPIEKFFPWFINLSHYTEVFEHVVSMEPLDQTPDGTAGKRYLERAKNFMGNIEEIPVTVLSSREEEELWAEAFNPRVKSLFRFGFRRAGNGGTFLEWEFHTRHTNPVVISGLKMILGRMFKNRLVEAEAKLQEIGKALSASS